MKKLITFIKTNRESIKESIEYGYIVCAMLLMFMGRTGAIISFLSLLVVVIASNIGGESKKGNKSVRHNTTDFIAKKSLNGKKTLKRAS